MKNEYFIAVCQSPSVGIRFIAAFRRNVSNWEEGIFINENETKIIIDLNICTKEEIENVLNTWRSWAGFSEFEIERKRDNLITIYDKSLSRTDHG